MRIEDPVAIATAPEAGSRTRPLLSRSLARRLVNLAGLVDGKQAACWGDPDASIAAAVAGTGARLYGPERPTTLRLDALFWDASASIWPDPESSVQAIGRYLRVGGRLVAWRGDVDGRDLSMAADCMRERIRRWGFTSVIAGSLSADSQEAVVATGIFHPMRTHRS